MKREPFHGPVYRVGGGVSAPKGLYVPAPEYTAEARNAKLEGKVMLWIIVASDGTVEDARVTRSLGKGLDEQAIKAVKQWRFDPAKRKGQPVAVQVNVEVNFRLDDAEAKLP